jgi:hypothetical protein
MAVAPFPKGGVGDGVAVAPFSKGGVGDGVAVAGIASTDASEITVISLVTVKTCRQRSFTVADRFGDAPAPFRVPPSGGRGATISGDRLKAGLRTEPGTSGFVVGVVAVMPPSKARGGGGV